LDCPLDGLSDGDSEGDDDDDDETDSSSSRKQRTMTLACRQAACSASWSSARELVSVMTTGTWRAGGRAVERAIESQRGVEGGVRARVGRIQIRTISGVVSAGSLAGGRTWDA